MNQIEQIKDILFSNEKRALDALTRRLEKRESRVADIADVLPESLGRSSAEGDKLVQSLRAPVEKCLKDSIARDPQNFADALFPVMGPAIRKSISEALKSFSESINQAIEEKTSIKSIRWRMEAKKAGIPYAQFLIQKKLEYRVEHAYLIQPSSGLLIADAHRLDAVRKDDEAISAMLTAIQDFVSESFGAGDEGTLKSADVGEYTLWTMRGPHAMLACVINGVPPRGLRETLIENLEGIHLQFPEVLERFDGQKTPKTLLIEPLLEDCLLQQAVEGQEKQKKKGIGIFGVFLITALLTAIAWFGWQKYQTNKNANLFIAALQAEPGIFLTDNEVKRGIITVRGLRDNSSTKIATILENLKIDPKKVDSKFTPFHSLEKEILHKRISSKLNIPADISYELSEDGSLSFEGQISSSFKNEAVNKLQNILGISSIDFSSIVYADKDILANANRILLPPSTVGMKVSSGVLELVGAAPYEWHKKLKTEQALQIAGLLEVNDADLEIAELDVIKNIEETLKNQSVKFVWRTGLKDGEAAKFPALALQLRSYGTELSKLGIDPEIELIGFTDSVGSIEQNRNIQNERAQYVKGRLVGLGVSSAWISVSTGVIDETSNDVDPDMRRVDIKLKTNLDSFIK